MKRQFDGLVDSDAFVGRFYPNDSHFHNASVIFAALEKQERSIVTTSLVVAETATVLSHRQGQTLARGFLEKLRQSRLPVIHITEALQQEAFRIFEAQSARGTSVTDCANVAVMRRLNIPTIFSFDNVYRQKFGLKTAS